MSIRQREGGSMDRDRQLIERVKREVLYGRDIVAPSVDAGRCTGCGTCVTVCVGGVFELRDHLSQVVSGWRCIACGHCTAVCPADAVTQPDASPSSSDVSPGPRPAAAPRDLQLLIRERRSTRVFSDDAVSREQLVQIVEAGRYAPTGANRQAVDYVILPDRARVAELRMHLEGFLNRMSNGLQNPVSRRFLQMRMGRKQLEVLRYYAASYRSYRDIPDAERKEIAYFPLPYGPAVIVAHTQSFDAIAEFNCAMALYACSLMAHTMGLASCFLGFVPAAAQMDKRVGDWLGIPEGNQVYGAIVVGHPRITYRRLVERRMPELTWL
jgi:nitroreductase/NAD-dependent dihydropyrimidine dehydrogenase PreA subunit